MRSSSPPLSFIYIASLPGLPLLPTLICSSTAMLTQACRLFASPHFIPSSPSVFNPPPTLFLTSLSCFLIMSLFSKTTIKAVVSTADNSAFFCALNHTSFHFKTLSASCICLSTPADKYLESGIHTSLHQHGDFTASGTFA